MALNIQPLEGQAAFGAMVVGLDPACLDDPEVRRTLNDLWIDKGVIVFRDTIGADMDVQIRLSEVFGPIIPHPVPQARLAEREEIVQLKYDPAAGDIYRVDGEVRANFLPWHSDLIYVAEINRGAILRALAVPARDGETGFIDQIAAYDTLDDVLKARIEGLEARYRAGSNAARKRFGPQKVEMIRLSPMSAVVDADADRYPKVLHPMVFRQAETRRKVLNVSPWFADGIDGMDKDEGDALLEEVVAHIERRADAYFHRWQLGDMVLWDNWRMLHGVRGMPLDEQRCMHRTTIKGDYGLGRIAPGETQMKIEKVFEV